MRKFYLKYRGSEKMQPLVAEIGWTHNVLIMSKCKDDLEREFSIRMTRKYGWSKNILIHQIEGNAYANYMISQNHFEKNLHEKYRNQAILAIKDEYQFDFLLFHRRLQSLVAIDLKVGEFIPEYAGKMQFYLSLLNDKVKLEHENPSIGIIICKSKNRTVVEYALRDTNQPIGVATYTMYSQLPEEWKKLLPSPEEIVRGLETIEDNYNK